MDSREQAQQAALLAQVQYALGATTNTGAKSKTPGQQTEAQMLQNMINRVMRKHNINERDLGGNISDR